MLQRCFSKPREMWLPIQRLIQTHCHLWLWQWFLCGPTRCLAEAAWLCGLPLKMQSDDWNSEQRWRGKVFACFWTARSGWSSGRSGASVQHSGPATSVKCAQWGKLGKVPLQTQKYTQCLEIYFHTIFFCKYHLICSLSPTRDHIYSRHSCLKLSRKRSIVHSNLII